MGLLDLCEGFRRLLSNIAVHPQSLAVFSKSHTVTMHNQEKGPVTLLYIILTTDHVGIKQTRLTPVYISSHMTLYL